VANLSESGRTTKTLTCSRIACSYERDGVHPGVIKASLDTTLLLLLQHTPWRCFFFTLSVVALGKSKTSQQNLEFLLLNTE
jgi:hypothetical protein